MIDEASSSITVGDVFSDSDGAILDYLESEYYREGDIKFYCNARYDDYLPSFHIPKMADYIHITNFDEESVFWRLDLIPEGSIKSIKSGVQVFEKRYGYKHRHDYVAHAISSLSTDVRLRDVFGSKGDEFDNKSPDFMFETEQFYHFVELTTRMSDEPGIINHAFDEKIFSYELPLRNRSVDSPLCVSLSVVVVTPTQVYSTIGLPQSVVDELIVRMRIAVSLEEKAAVIGLNLRDDEKDRLGEIIKDQIYTQIKSVKFNDWDEDRSPFYVTKEYISMIKKKCDPQVFQRIIMSETRKCREELGPRSIPDHEEILGNFIKKHSDPSRRMDNKPVSPFPLFSLPQEDEMSSDIPTVMVPSISAKPYLTKMWQKALQDAMIDPEFLPEDQAEVIRIALGESPDVRDEEDIRSRNKKKYHRVDLAKILTEEERMDLARQGVWAKRFKGNDIIQERQHDQKKSFSWNTDTEDISALIADPSLLDPCKPPVRSTIVDQLAHAEELTENSPDGVNCLREWETTKLFRACDIISAIAFEIAVANKQHCKPGTMILKKVRGYKILLLISPTKSDEHTFYSILFYNTPERPMHAGAMGSPMRCGSCWVTDFASLKTGKIENLSTIQASLLAIASYCQWYHDLPDASPASVQGDPLAMKTLMTLLLTRIEDKSYTEQTMSQVRYMYMEIFKSNYTITWPNPFAILKKVPDYQRSRLSLYFLKNIVRAFLQMTSTPPERLVIETNPCVDEGDDPDPPKDAWSGLVDWATGGLVASASKIVNVFYYGYFSNKNKTSEGNTDWSILEKTAEEELNFDKSQPEKSMGECHEEPPRGKQFSHEAIRLGAELLAARLEAAFGPNWKEKNCEGLLDALSKRMTEEIATLKASCSIPHKVSYDPSRLDKNLGANRIFVVEALIQILEKVKLNPMTNIKAFIEFIERTTKVVISDLFKKNQFGGLREIYVLTIESRILQIFLETISRWLCSQFPEETLTHPKNKMKILDDHRVYSARKSRAEQRVHVDYCSSTDKTRWNQNFVMSAMIIPLITLTPEEFHSPIQRIINMWVGKLIKIPQRVINLLLSQTPLSSPIYMELLEDFWRKDNHKLINQEKGEFLRLESGMMQGILHFTSSLLHLCYLSATSYMVPKILKSSFPEYDFRMTQACSSDDSATILTVFSPPNCSSLTVKMLAVFIESSRMLHVLPRLAPYFCMKDSPKSNTANLDYIEYNSEFTFKNTIACPISKMVAASLGLSEAECFNERFHTQYNLLADLFSSGFPAYNTHLVQVAQGYIHYLTMGAHVNPCFPLYMRELKDYPDPALGFFLMDTEFAPGTLGFSYSHWLASTKTSILNQSLNQKLAECGVVNETGGVTGSVFIRHGEVRRWKRLVEGVVKDMNLQGELERNPEILFRNATTLKELRVKLAAKVTSPDVAKALRKGNAFMQAIATSVYAISTHCYTKVTVTSEFGKAERSTEKISLLSEVIKRKREPRRLELSEACLNVSFPAWERYKTARQVLLKFQGVIPTRRPRLRNRRSVVTIQPMNQLIPLSLQDSCCHQWFGWKVRATGEVARRCWLIYQEKFPWLRETFPETLLQSPFTTAQELSNMVKSQRFKTRQFVRIGPSISSKGFRGQLFQLCKRSYKEGFSLQLSRAGHSFIDKSELQTKIALALTLPEQTKEMHVQRILTTSPLLFEKPNDTKMAPKREAVLGLIQLFVKSTASGRPKITDEDIVNSVLESGSGVVITYLKPQTRVVSEDGRVEWKGEGLCLARYSNVMISVHMEDSLAVKVMTSDWERLRLRPGVLSHILRELNLRAQRVPETTAGMVGKFDGTNFVSPRSTGCPVFETRSFSASPASDIKLRLKIRGTVISVYQMQGERDFEFLRYVARPGDITQLRSGLPERNPNKAWLSQSSLSLDQALVFLRDFDRHPVHTQRWIRDSFKARLTHRGVGSKFISKHILEDMDSDDEGNENELVSDEFLDIMMEELTFGKTVQCDVLLEAATEEHMEEAQDYENLINDALDSDPWKAAVHGLMEYDDPLDKRLSPREYKDFKYLHPFWDQLIDGPMMTTPGFWASVSQGEVPASDSDLAAIVMKALSIKKERARKSLLELASSRVKEVDFSEEPGTPVAAPRHGFTMREEEFPSLPGGEQSEEEDDDEDFW
nr:TPA_asm: RdRp [Cotesiavirus chinense]